MFFQVFDFVHALWEMEFLLALVRFYSAIAQLVERMTVNHDVTGSSPVGGVS